MDNARPSWLLSGVRWPLALRWRHSRPTHRGSAPSWAALVLLVSHVCLGETASSQAELFRAAERAEGSFDFGAALAGYEAAVAANPHGTLASAADLRARYLREHSEGGFAPLARVERIRRTPELASSAGAIDALVREARQFPDGAVRGEARMLAAEAYAQRLRRPEDAPVLWQLVLADDRAGAAKTLAARNLVSYHLAHGEDRAAEDVVRLAGSSADEMLARDVTRIVRRKSIRIWAIVVVAGSGLVGALVVAAFARRHGGRALWARTRSSASPIAAFAGFTAVGGALLASTYESGTAVPFLAFGLALGALLLLARAWGAAGSQGGLARAARAVACGASVLGAAYLVLERVDGDYLSGLGL